MAKLQVQAPDGKTLLVDVAPGTDPKDYGSAADEVVNHYMNSTHFAGIEAEKGAYPNESYTSSPNTDILSAAIPAIGPAKTAIGAGAQLARGLVKTGGALMAPSVDAATEALLPTLEKAGLKDVAPIIFDKGERGAAVQYAQKTADAASQGLLSPKELQEGRATLKDVLDNNIVSPSSPTGQIVSRAKDAITSALKSASSQAGDVVSAVKSGAAEMLPGQSLDAQQALSQVGPALDQTGAAYAAAPVKAAISKSLSGAIPFGLGYAARNALRLGSTIYNQGQNQ